MMQPIASNYAFELLNYILYMQEPRATPIPWEIGSLLHTSPHSHACRGIHDFTASMNFSASQ